MHTTLRLLLLSALSLPLFSPSAFAAAAPSFTLSDSGALATLSTATETITFAPGGGFSARDVTAATGAGKTIDLSRGAITKSGNAGGKLIFKSAPAGGITLHAEFTPNPAGFIQVDGFLENTAGDDRAIILDYRLCLPGDDLVFSFDVNQNQDVALSKTKTETEASAFPLAALGAPGKTAVSIAIPWNTPLVFGVAGAGNALIMRLYLGISPLPKLFPNKAPFSFIIYPSRADWGFRGSLEKYYQFYPDRYEPRSKDAGFYLYMEKGNVLENMRQFSHNVVEIQNPHFQADLERNDKYNITSLVYTIVGQREVKFLPKVPATYDEAMTAFANWKLEDHKAHPITKENVASEGDLWLRDEIENSSVKDHDGKYVLMLRTTHWGKHSATFKQNPSPWLFDDKPAMRTVGRDSLATIDKWLAQYPRLKGVIVDSLGARWPAVLNYRKDHMQYARHALTFDSKGRLSMHNTTSHFEWLEALRDRLAPQNKLLAANGVYSYLTSTHEHYRAAEGKTGRPARVKVGRFFISALLDAAASETGAKTSTERAQEVRLMMGRKYYAITNYKWLDKEDVEQFHNRSLSLAIFATNNRDPQQGGEYKENVFEGLDYWGNPQGYGRDKALLDWFLPKARMLFKAGWEPVTHARKLAGGDNVYIERFGRGGKIYFTIFNDTDATVDFAMKLDLMALGITEGSADYEELAQDADLDIPAPDEVRLTLPPYKTRIICLTPVQG